MARDRGKQPERVSHNDMTLFKVSMGLKAAGITGQLAIDAIAEMQNQGILFRERTAEPPVTEALKRALYGVYMEGLNPDTSGYYAREAEEDGLLAVYKAGIAVGRRTEE